MSKEKYIFQVPPTLYGELKELKYKADKYDKYKEVLDKLQQENEQLQNNWDELKKWLEELQQEEFDINGFTGVCTEIRINCILNKMQELEKVE